MKQTASDQNGGDITQSDTKQIELERDQLKSKLMVSIIYIRKQHVNSLFPI